MNEVLAFWSAYILTRPLGASFADWLGKPRDRSGVGLGDGPVSLVFAVLIVACVAAMTRTWRRTPAPPVRSGDLAGPVD